ncbi:MAG: hypothetical protein HY964_07070 [Ignavibacteriales bacterium]|nr:hypothetical protein [Ignavibacteriales bacterium]
MNKYSYYFIFYLAQFILIQNAGYGNQISESAFEVKGCRADVKINHHNQSIECIDTLTLRKISGGDIFKARLAPLYEIKEITIDGDPFEYNFEKGSLSIPNLPGDSTIDIVISYKGIWKLRSEFSAITSQYAIFRDVELFPTSAGIYEFVKIKIEVPSGWKTVAAGDLVAVESVMDKEIHHWFCSEPLSEIGWICAGNYWTEGQLSNTILFDCLGFRDDSINLTSVIPFVKDAVFYYSKKYSAYRFKKMSIIEVDDWVAGGNVLAIAAPSFIMVKRIAFTTEDQFNRVESIIAHEVAHEWFPLTVFIDRADAAFLAEGLCEYSSLLFHKETGMMTRRDSLKDHPLLRPLLTRAKLGKDLPLQQLADLRYLTTHYLKATYVHHMLNRLVGDSIYAQMLKCYVEKYSERRVRFEEFITIAESISGMNLGWFFNQWVKKKGIPRLKLYNVKSEQSRSGWRTRGRIRITGYEKFRVDGFLGLNNKNMMEKFSFSLGSETGGVYQNDIPFEIITEENPERVVIDPDGDMLKMQKLPAKISDLREPSDGIMIIGTGDSNLYETATKDSVELAKAGWEIKIKRDEEASLRDFQNERVFIYGKSSTNSILAEVEKKYHFKFSNDSLLLPESSLFDSSLTLIEALDNPYFSNGLIIRVAPFSPKAKPVLRPFDYSWVLLRGKDKIDSGVWDDEDEDLVVELKYLRR